MDRKAWIAVVLSILGLIAWQWYYVHKYSPKPGAPRPQTAEAAPKSPSPSAPVAAPSPIPEEPVIAAQNTSLYSQSAEYVFSNDKGGIERANLLLHRGENEQPV